MENSYALINSMKNGKTLSGFHFYIGRKDYFCKTDYKNKTQILARKILRKLSVPENSDTIKEILYYITPAKCEIEYLHSMGKYSFRIFGKDFDGYGSDDITDGKTIIFEV